MPADDSDGTWLASFAASSDSVLPEVAVQSSPTDRYGVALARISYASSVCLSGTPTDHLIGIICSNAVPTEHTMADIRLYHEAGPGSLCICPAETDYVTAFGGPVDGIVMRISAECLALAKAHFEVYGATLVEQMDGRDEGLVQIARTLEAEAAAGHPNGMLFWCSITDALFRRLATHHLSLSARPLQGSLNAAALRRLDAYIRDNLAEPLDLASLAAIVGCDRFHFAHRFRKSVGISPYRYVVRKRVDRARELLLHGEESLAEIAAATGFSDQSHLSNWVRRIYGTSPGRLVASR
jgi:AraC family transcriptional regulator